MRTRGAGPCAPVHLHGARGRGPGALDRAAGARGLDSEERTRAERIAGEGSGLAWAAGFVAEPLVVRRDGAPWRAIVECAADIDAAAIVTGTRGRSRAVAAVLGSTAEGVLHHAHRPVVLVPGA